ncbi:MAG: hypothetical protein ABW168_11645 [Sedimenticola sp.]
MFFELYFLIGALLLFLFIGVKASRGITVSDFENNSSSTNIYQLVLSILASLLGGFMFFGLTALSYESGVVSFIIGLGYSIGLLILAHYSGPIFSLMRDADAPTMDAVVGMKFGKEVYGLVVIINFTFFISVLSAQFIVFSDVISHFNGGHNETVMYVLMSATVVGYSIFSGYKGVLKTDIIQFIFILIIIITLLYTIFHDQSLDWVASLPNEYFTGLAEGPVFLIGVLVFFPLTLMARTDLWQRIGSASNARDAKIALKLVAIVIPIFYLVFTVFGMFSAAQSNNVDPTSAFLTTAISSFSFGNPIDSILSSLLLLGIVAALVSTIDTNLNVVSVAVGKKIASKVGKEPGLTHYRIFVVIFGVFGAVAPFYLNDLVDVIVGAATMLLLMLPLVIISILVNKPLSGTLRMSAAVGLALGYFCCMYLLFNGNPKTAFLPSIAIAIIPLLVVFIWKKVSEYFKAQEQ